MKMISRLLGVAAGLAISACVTMPAFSADDGDVATTFYNQIMEGQTKYAAIRSNKAYASCIDWDKSTRQQVNARYLLWYYAESDVPMFVSKLANSALNYCEDLRKEEGISCDYVIIDKNGSSTLKVPQKYLDLYDKQ